jgi:GT2 family glycosyltransferase
MAVNALHCDHRVAVVMITWNRRTEVLRSLGRLLALPEQPAIVLVDNGSTDGTASEVAAWFPMVDVVRAGRNIGTAARNLGIQRCDRPYIALSDDDTWWSAGSLRHAADLFDAHPRLAVACARVIVESTGREDPACRVMQKSPLFRPPGMPGSSILGFLAGASMIRRSAVLEAGGFPTNAGIGGEEQWLAADLAERHWWMCYVPELCVHHDPSPKRNTAGRRQRLLRNALWFAWLRRPLPRAVRGTLELAREERWDWATVRGFAGGVLGAMLRIAHRRVLTPEVEQSFVLLETHRDT